MRNARFDLTFLTVNGIPVELVGGSLIVAEPEGITTPDWEAVCRSTETLELQRQPYDVELGTEDRQFAGAALLVRSDGTSHVFRGGSPLMGVRDGDLQ